MVLIEVPLNAYVLWVNREALPDVWRRLLPIVIGLLPGIALGTLIVAQVSPARLRFFTFVVLLPLILLAGGGLSPADPIGALGRFWIRRRPWRVVFRDDHFRSAAGGDVEQPGLRET